jgi:hypothetical protein
MSKQKKVVSTAVATINNGNGRALYQLDDESPDMAGFKSLRIPIIKPREMPVGAFVIAEITAIVPSPVKEYKSELLCMTDLQGRQFSFPITATIKRALEPDANDFIGKTLMIKKTGEAMGKTNKKMVHLFDVAVKE